LALYFLVADDQSNAEIYSAAFSSDQARICWSDALGMVSRNAELSSRIETRVASLFYPERQNVFRHLSSEHRAYHGKRVTLAVLDELHVHQNSEVVDAMRISTKGRPNSLIFEITNSGHDLLTVCGEHHEHSLAILSGEEQDDSWFAFVAGVDAGDDVFADEQVWEKSNPGIRYSLPPASYVRAQVAEALAMPSKQSLVRRYCFCEWVQTAEGWLPMDKWDANAADVHIEDFAGKPCWLGVDLSNTQDLTVVAAIFKESTTADSQGVTVTAAVGDDEYTAKDVNIDFKVTVFANFYMPAGAVTAHERSDRAPYGLWRDQGWLTATPQPTVDYSRILGDILRLNSICPIVECGMDPYNSNWLAGKLLEVQPKPIPVTMVRQSVQSLSEPEQIIEALVLSGRLIHDGNPLMRMCAANTVVSRDLKDNIFCKKPSNFKRIDGMIALAMAVARMIAAPPPKREPEYQAFFVG
jgi:phage terminase large subunit-like protein